MAGRVAGAVSESVMRPEEGTVQQAEAEMDNNLKQVEETFSTQPVKQTQSGRGRGGRRGRPSKQPEVIIVKSRGTPIVAYINRVRDLFESGYGMVKLVAVGAAVDRAFAVGQEISNIYNVYLDMTTKLEQARDSEDGESMVQQSTITISSMPITKRQYLIQQNQVHFRSNSRGRGRGRGRGRRGGGMDRGDEARLQSNPRYTRRPRRTPNEAEAQNNEETENDGAAQEDARPQRQRRPRRYRREARDKQEAGEADENTTAQEVKQEAQEEPPAAQE